MKSTRKLTVLVGLAVLALLLLLAAETATDYYAHIGFTKVENGWMLPRKK